MKYLLSAILLAMSFAPLAAQADIAPDPGTHRYHVCAVIDNLADFPLYDVYQNVGERFPVAGLVSGPIASVTGCGGSSTDFFAVKESDQAKIVHETDPNGESGDIWNTLAINQPYIIGEAVITGQAPDITKELVSGGNLPDSNKTVNIIDVYHIDRLNPTNFTLTYVSESRYDASGKLVSGPALGQPTITTEQIKDAAPTLPSEFTAQDDNGKIQLSVPASASSPMALVWIVVVCMGAVVLALAIKTWKK